MAEDLAHLGHWSLDAEDGMIEGSPQAWTVLGLGRVRSLHVSSALDAFAAEDRREILGAAILARREGRDVSCRVRVRTDGGHRPVLLQMHVDDGQGGGGRALFGMIRDITDKVLAEEVLVAARDDAVAATRAKSEFLATICHEIRTPMTGVMGMIDLLLTNPPVEERDRYLAAMKQSAELLMSVLDGILDFSKVESGKLELHESHFDLAELIRRTIDMFQNSASRKGLVFDLRIDPGSSPIVVGDAIRVQQVLSNLISNAIKFTDRGHIVVVARASCRGGNRQHWHVEVEDTGVGISQVEQARLFEPFFQTGHRQSGGTGLGLAISRRLIEAMNGKSGVCSVPRRGSTFWFEVDLPVGDPGKLPRVAVASPSEQDDKLHILLAEDNPINQMLVIALIRQMGHRVTCVNDGRRAVEAAAAMVFDCILMDMQMPEMDGLTATRTIRASKGPEAGVRIIALSADAAPDRRRFYDNAGLDDFLTKPISAESLRRALCGVSRFAADVGGPWEPGIDSGRLSELRGIIGEARFRSLIALFCTELIERQAEIRGAANQRDSTALRSHAHNLKGAAANLGAEGVARAARAVELATMGAELQLALDRLAQEAAAAQTQLSHILAEERSGKRSKG